MSSRVSLTLQGEGTSLVLVGHLSRDGITIKIPLGRCFITSTSLAPHLFLLVLLKLKLILSFDQLRLSWGDECRW